MKTILSTLFLISALLFSDVAFADESKTFSWVAPTEYTNGWTIPDGVILSYDITCNGVLLANVGSNLDSYVHTLTTGDYSCYIQAVTAISISDPSATVSTTAAGDPPLVPSQVVNFTIT